tara:strand:- start:1219 stop:1923 length:705 start_codon:yes stop_codon:yes gene_type:complete
MGFKMKGFSGFRKQNSKSTFKSALPKKEITPLKAFGDDYVSEIRDVDDWIALRDKYPPKENWKYTDQEWQEVMLPHDDVYHNLPDEELHRDLPNWDRRKPEVDTDMEDVEVKAPRSLQYGTSSKDLKNVSYKDTSKWRSWKRQLAKQGYRGAEIDNSYEAFLRGDKPDPSLSRKGRLGKKTKKLQTTTQASAQKGDKKKKKWKDTKVGRSLSGVDLSQLGAQTKDTLDSIFGGV